MLGDIEEFITGHREISLIDLDRILATVLFTDIVDSTRSAAEMGDQTWRRLLDSHDELAKEMVEKHRGTLIKTTGDGILATFDGPGRAVRCALAFRAAAKQIGLPLRAGKWCCFEQGDSDACVQKGATVAFNEAANAKARADVHGFLKKVFASK